MIAVNTELMAILTALRGQRYQTRHWQMKAKLQKEFDSTQQCFWKAQVKLFRCPLR